MELIGYPPPQSSCHKYPNDEVLTVKNWRFFSNLEIFSVYNN